MPQKRRFNRATTRALIKAARCLDRSTRIPHGVRSKVGTMDPMLLERLAAKHGKTIGGNGCVSPLALSDGPSTSADAIEGTAA